MFKKGPRNIFILILRAYGNKSPNANHYKIQSTLVFCYFIAQPQTTRPPDHHTIILPYYQTTRPSDHQCICRLFFFHFIFLQMEMDFNYNDPDLADILSTLECYFCTIRQRIFATFCTLCAVSRQKFRLIYCRCLTRVRVPLL